MLAFLTVPKIMVIIVKVAMTIFPNLSQTAFSIYCVPGRSFHRLSYSLLFPGVRYGTHVFYHFYTKYTRPHPDELIS
jgi:hypothetical protein